jgi:hypothetical protein
MKLVISKSEVLEILRKSLNLPVDVNIELEVSQNAELSYGDSVLIQEIDKLDWRYSAKITAIKKLREYTNCSLFDGKTAIENWPTFKEFAKSQGRFPKLGVEKFI